MLKGRVRDVKDIARKGDTVIFSAISLHDLNIYIKNLAKGKKVLTGTVIKTHDNYITVETDNNIVITRRECIMLSNRDDTFKCFVLD
jgi:ABC-type uncharacterized transport system ATPase subunit